MSALGGRERDLQRQGLARRLAFAAFSFMTQVAPAAWKADDPGEWSCCYRRVDIVLTTPAAGGITRLDVELAEAINRLAAAIG